jgi:hypothetical protein
VQPDISRIMIDDTTALGSPTSSHVWMIERAINMQMKSPTTGIMPMRADHPTRNPQQQQVNDRSVVS